ncbi:uncharacterized protein LOC125611107 [Marmota marmota marmota]|uniref:uncharacterized protein LOC125611107 n=1 Tax=Marmota marmota marmota TaxID=9994 RepID=UPI00209393C7|nr:uncharacterized protein LOC125611107 [Marmota marmota marmota]XP_048640913.1 uncharacterized protein LOC125611107 [Marmota marmota marmota]XP_048640914.1 uncharacterized protein LOC125611107 [Marmota marmota marmota]XP_048640915.1 uncharacterized protein LOC125611107 [Marmota marmota marmota]
MVDASGSANCTHLLEITLELSGTGGLWPWARSRGKLSGFHCNPWPTPQPLADLEDREDQGAGVRGTWPMASESRRGCLTPASNHNQSAWRQQPILKSPGDGDLSNGPVEQEGWACPHPGRSRGVPTTDSLRIIASIFPPPNQSWKCWLLGDIGPHLHIPTDVSIRNHLDSRQGCQSPGPHAPWRTQIWVCFYGQSFPGHLQVPGHWETGTQCSGSLPLRVSRVHSLLHYLILQGAHCKTPRDSFLGVIMARIQAKPNGLHCRGLVFPGRRSRATSPNPSVQEGSPQSNWPALEPAAMEPSLEQLNCHFSF